MGSGRARLVSRLVCNIKRSEILPTQLHHLAHGQSGPAMKRFLNQRAHGSPKCAIVFQQRAERAPKFIGYVFGKSHGLNLKPLTGRE